MSKFFYIDMRFRAVGHADEAELELKLDEIVEHLAELDRVQDPDLTAALATGDVVFSVGINATDGPAALRDALVAVRTAAHACGAGTPGWDDMFHEVEQTIRAADAEDLVDA